MHKNNHTLTKTRSLSFYFLPKYQKINTFGKLYTIGLNFLLSSWSEAAGRCDRVYLPKIFIHGVVEQFLHVGDGGADGIFLFFDRLDFFGKGLLESERRDRDVYTF